MFILHGFRNGLWPAAISNFYTVLYHYLSASFGKILLKVQVMSPKIYRDDHVSMMVITKSDQLKYCSAICYRVIMIGIMSS